MIGIFVVAMVVSVNANAFLVSDYANAPSRDCKVYSGTDDHGYSANLGGDHIPSKNHITRWTTQHDPVPGLESMKLRADDDSDDHWKYLGYGKYDWNRIGESDRYATILAQGQPAYDRFLLASFGQSPDGMISEGELQDLSEPADGKFDDYRTVHGDNISPVPVPAAIWLFGTALAGFIFYSRRRVVN